MSYDLTNAVLLRPQMYTATGSFLEVVAFLEGYYSGLARDSRAKAQVERWSNFHQFIEEQQGNQSSDVWIMLHRQYKDETLRMLKALYDEFCRLQVAGSASNLSNSPS